MLFALIEQLFPETEVATGMRFGDVLKVRTSKQVISCPVWQNVYPPIVSTMFNIDKTKTHRICGSLSWVKTEGFSSSRITGSWSF